MLRHRTPSEAPHAYPSSTLHPCSPSAPDAPELYPPRKPTLSAVSWRLTAAATQHESALLPYYLFGEVCLGLNDLCFPLYLSDVILEDVDGAFLGTSLD